jgi:hypothetical protein
MPPHDQLDAIAKNGNGGWKNEYLY